MRISSARNWSHEDTTTTKYQGIDVVMWYKRAFSTERAIIYECLLWTYKLYQLSIDL